MFGSVTFRSLPDNLKWETVTIAKGESIEGWVFGKLICIESHWTNGRSLPCREWCTGGKLKCPCRTEFIARRIIGYLPLYTKEKEKIVVMLSETVCQKMETVRMGTPIKLTRPKRGIRPLTVTLISDYEVNSDITKKIRQMAPHDIEPYLLHLWQDRELTEAFGCEHIPAAQFKQQNVETTDAA